MEIAEIEFMNVWPSYGHDGNRHIRPLTDSCTFSLTKNEVHIVSGDNGSGKTSVLKSLIGAVPQIEGDVRVSYDDGEEWTMSLGEFHRAGIPSVYMPQRVLGMFPSRTSVSKVLELWGRFGRYYDTKEKRESLCSRLGLVDLIREDEWVHCRKFPTSLCWAGSDVGREVSEFPSQWTTTEPNVDRVKRSPT